MFDYIFPIFVFGTRHHRHRDQRAPHGRRNGGFPGRRSGKRQIGTTALRPFGSGNLALSVDRKRWPKWKREPLKKAKFNPVARNIDNKGRLFRATAAVVTGTAALLLWPSSPIVSGSLAAATVFMGFEAARGWCALRACGIKTKF